MKRDLKQQTWAQSERQRHRDGGKYALVNPCYRCGKSAGVDYYSFLCDSEDSLGNCWSDKALCVCQKCVAYLEKLYETLPAAPWQEACSSDWGNLPQGKAAIKRGVTRITPRIPAKVGRKRVGEVISVCLTDEQKAWIDAQIPAGGTRAQVIRAVIQKAMEGGF